MPRIVVGVDAGASTTVAALAQDGRIVRTHAGPPANASVRGVEAASAAIAQSILAALDGALPHAIFVGAAGASREDVASGIRETLESHFPQARVGVRDDAFIALRAGVPQGDGAVLIAGTGSIAFAQCGGREFRAGGYGYLLGDEGSGFALGSAALKVVLRAYDGRAPLDDFAKRIAQEFGAQSATDVLARAYSERNAVTPIAALAPIVLEAAAQGDRSASKIVQAASLELAELAKSVVKRAAFPESGTPLVLAGSLLRSNSLLTFLLETRLQNDLPAMSVFKASEEPVAGAVAAAQLL